MGDLRTYGVRPFSIAVLHGGPGAAGEMAPVAHRLASKWGVLELLQLATSVEGQIEETIQTLEENGDIPLTLVGFSWGAWLSLMISAQHPQFVKKLILVGCGPLLEEYAHGILQTRLDRLSPAEKSEAESLMDVMNDPATEDKNEAFQKVGVLYAKADAYDPMPNESDDLDRIEPRVDIFRKVWNEAVELRRNERLLHLARAITCPVVAIHGEYDPHPAEGVIHPLSAALREFTFILLEKCGHKPWIEKEAKAGFYEILFEELQDVTSLGK